MPGERRECKRKGRVALSKRCETVRQEFVIPGGARNLSYFSGKPKRDASLRKTPLGMTGFDSGLWFFYEEMSVWIGAGEDAEAKNVGDHE
jgi:hypothetical protein